MLAYNKMWLDALETREKTNYWFQKNLLSEKKRAEINEKYPSHFYSPNPFIRVGLAIFTFILVAAAVGILMLFFTPDSTFAQILLAFFSGAGLLFVSEKIFIQQKKHLRSGIDDCLVYLSVWAFALGFFQILPNNSPIEFYLFFPMILCALAAARYADFLLAVAAAGLAVTLILMLINRLSGSYAPLVLPFSGMACAAVLYFWSRNWAKKHVFRFWRTPLLFVEAGALLLFYASGNYFVIQNLGQDLFEMQVVPLAKMFWGLTFLVPVAYIFLGLRRKGRLLLDIGFFCTVAAIASFRHYFNVMPLAWAASLAGAILLATAWFSIRLLKNGNPGFTYDEDGGKTKIQQMQGQFIDMNFGQTPQSGGPKTGAGGDF